MRAYEGRYFKTRSEAELFGRRGRENLFRLQRRRGREVAKVGERPLLGPRHLELRALAPRYAGHRSRDATPNYFARGTRPRAASPARRCRGGGAGSRCSPGRRLYFTNGRVARRPPKTRPRADELLELVGLEAHPRLRRLAERVPQLLALLRHEPRDDDRARNRGPRDAAGLARRRARRRFPPTAAAAPPAPRRAPASRAAPARAAPGSGPSPPR